MLYITSVILLTGSLYLLTTFIQFPSSHFTNFTNVYLIVEDRVITIKRRQPWQLKSCGYFFQMKIQLFSTVIWNRDDTRSKVRVTFKRVRSYWLRWSFLQSEAILWLSDSVFSNDCQMKSQEAISQFSYDHLWGPRPT